MAARPVGMAVGGGAASAPAGIGHNGGPPLEHRPPWGDLGGERIGIFVACRAAARVRRAPPSLAILKIRLRNAERLGLTYDEYAREIAERGRHLQPADSARIDEIKAARRPSHTSE